MKEKLRKIFKLVSLQKKKLSVFRQLPLLKNYLFKNSATAAKAWGIPAGFLPPA